MGNGNSRKITDGLNGRSALIVAIVGAIFGSISGPVLLVKFGGDSVVAPDRFTGTQGQLLEARITTLETGHAALRSNQVRHFSEHPDQTGRFDARLTALEAQLAIMLANQQRIMTMLETR